MKKEKQPLSQEEKALRWEEITTEHIVSDQWIDFRKTAYRMPDGKVYEPYYTYTRKDYSVIVASDTEGKFICVRQFRQGIRQVTTEFPAGGIEMKDDIEDYALSAAVRELREETGYVSEEWEHLLTIPSNPTMCDNHAYLYRAKNCRKVTGQELDDMEFLNVERYSAEEIDQMIEKGEFEQPVHLAAWLLSQRK